MAEVLTPTIEAQIRRHVGSVEHVEGLEERVARLVAPAAVALEIALERVGELATTDGTTRFGDESTARTQADHDAANALVSKLATMIRNSTTITITPAITELLEAAEAEADTTEITSIASTVSHARPG